MIAFTEDLKHNADSLAEKAVQYAAFRAVCSTVLCCCLGLCIFTLPCRAQSPSETSDNQTLQVTFISLKPGNTIGPSQLRLHADSTLDFSIKNETLANTEGIWSLQAHRFFATVNFMIDKQAPFHYRLQFNGYLLWGLHIGRARMHEYDCNERLTQQINFLFYAVPPDFFRVQQRIKRDKGE